MNKIYLSLILLLVALPLSLATVEDNFNRADSSSVGTATNGNTWTDTLDWGIVSFKAVDSTSGEDDMSLLFDSPNPTSINFTINWTNFAVNTQRIWLYDSATPSTSQIQLASVDNTLKYYSGSWQPTGFTPTNNEEYEFEINDITSTTFDLWIDGVQYVDDGGRWNSADIDGITFRGDDGTVTVDCLTTNGDSCFLSNPVLGNFNCTSSGDDTSPYETNDTTPTFTLSTDVLSNCRIADINVSYDSMGSSRDCQTTGGYSHVCSLSSSDALYSQDAITYVACSNVYNSSIYTVEGLQMNITGLATSTVSYLLYGVQDSSVWPDADLYQNQQVFLRNLNNDQFVGIVDYVVAYGDQRWLLNYENSSALGLFNISPSVYVLDLVNENNGDIPSLVTDLIDSTKR